MNRLVFPLAICMLTIVANAAAAEAQELRTAVPISSVKRFTVKLEKGRIRCGNADGKIAYGKRRGSVFVPYPVLRTEIADKMRLGGDFKTLNAENLRLFSRHLACLNSLLPPPRATPTPRPVSTPKPKPVRTPEPTPAAGGVPPSGGGDASNLLCTAAATVEVCEFSVDPLSTDFNFYTDEECFYEPVLGFASGDGGGGTKSLAEERCRSEVDFRLSFGNGPYSQIRLIEGCGKAACSKNPFPPGFPP